MKLWNAKEVQLIAEANNIASGGTGYFSRHVTATISTRFDDLAGSSYRSVSGLFMGESWFMLHF